MTINMHQGDEAFTVRIEGSNASFDGDVESREETFEASMTENDMQLEASMEENKQTFDADMGEVQLVPGGSSEPGKDGFSPIVDLTETAEGVQITVVDVEGEETALVRHGKDGRDGKDGLPGERGETGPAGPQGKRGLQGIQGVPGEQGPQGIQGPAGKDGQPGERGQAGEPGQPGADGISPEVTVQDITGGHRVTITDKHGAKTFDVMDGKDGTGGGGGAQVQADWAVNDPDNPAYVQNRTHYEIPAFEPILWDGSMEGRFALDLSMLGYPDGQYFVKVSDVVPFIEDVTNGKILLSVGDENPITASSIDETMFPGAYVVDMLVVVVHDQSALNGALGLPDGYVTNGTYFLWNNGLYVSRLTTGQTTIKKIDQKFLPEMKAPEVVIPEGVQSDWSQNDETKPDFVKNRTHYEVPTTYDITWDGDMTGRPTLDVSDMVGFNAYLVKVSDRVYTKDGLGGKSLVYNDGGEEAIDSSSFNEDFPGALVYGYFEFAVLYDSDSFCSALGFPNGSYTNGTYFLTNPPNDMYVAAIGQIGYVAKLDEKYMPDVTLRKYEIFEEYNRLRCNIDEGWVEATKIDWSEGSLWSNVLPKIRGNIIAVKVSVNTAIDICTFVMSDQYLSVGSCYREDNNLGTIQVFFKVHTIQKKVYVAAKTVTI